MWLIFQVGASAWVWWTGSEEGNVEVCTAATGGATSLPSQTALILLDRGGSTGPTRRVRANCSTSSKN